MEFTEIFGILLIALVIGSLFYFGSKRRSPFGPFWLFIFILFLGAWAARMWVIPVGPVLWGFAWIPIVFFVIIVTLLIAAAAPRDERLREEAEDVQTRSTPKGSSETNAVIGIFFWLLMILFITAIIVGLWR